MNMVHLMKRHLTKLRRAIKQKELRQAKIADDLGVDQSLISKKLCGVTPLQPHDVKYFAKMTGLSREEISPEIYGEASGV